MRNRAKCKLCGTLLESYTAFDYVACKCGEIAIDGGRSAFKCFAMNFNNFIRIDDLGNEIPVKIKEENTKKDIDQSVPTRKELLDMLENMANEIERLPEGARLMPINNYDFASLILLLVSIFKLER